MDTVMGAVVKQHLIDPESCIRCNTCESTCPSGAITHGTGELRGRFRQVPALHGVHPALPDGCDRQLAHGAACYGLQRRGTAGLGLAADELTPAEGVAAGVYGTVAAVAGVPSAGVAAATAPAGTRYGATRPPWSAAHPYTKLYDASSPVVASVTGNMRVTEVGREYDTHHIVLDLGKTPFPVLEGQSIGVIPPGVDAAGRPHHARQYSISSARDGERPGFNNLSLTVKRVLQDRQGKPVHGVASNYLCDLKVGDKVQVIGPFGTSFLMPNHPGSHLVMICTGTGAAPMRAMLRRRHHQRTTQSFASGKLMLFFGARTPQELPFFGRLDKLPKDLLDVNLAFSRVTGQPRRYVQDLMRERAADLAALLADEDSYFYVCGLKSMEEGVVLALRDIAEGAGLRWDTVADALKRDGRLHLETY